MTPRRMHCALFLLPLFVPMIGCSVVDGFNPAKMATSKGTGQSLPITAVAVMKGQSFDLEVTKTSREKSLGLMFRPALPDNRGMLFSFDPPQPLQFWMKDVPVPLDIVFLRDVVVAILYSVPPCPTEPCPAYGPEGELIDQVIELKGGRTAEIGLETGDTVDIQPLLGVR